MCEQRTEHPPDCTVCVDRRSRGGGSRRSWPGAPAVRQRADHLGGGPGVAGVSLRTPLDPACPQQRPVAGHVSLPARPVGLPQAVEKRSTVALQGDPHPGRVLPVVVRRPVDDRRHPGALRHVARDGATLGVGRACRLRLLRVAFPLVLGAQALPGVHRRRDGRSCGAWPTPRSGNARWSPRC
jgi:hypothetical protein